MSAGFLTPEELTLLTALAKSNKLEHRVARRANAMVLLHEGWNFDRVAQALLMDDSTIREWYADLRATGVEGLKEFQHKGGMPRLSAEQEATLTAWVTETLPRTTSAVAQWMADEVGIRFESRSGIIKLLHRLGFEHRKPEAVPAKADVVKQNDFIDQYETQQNGLEADEATVFVDAVHPTHGAHPIALLSAIETMHSDKRRIHVYLDNARYHHAKVVREWLEQPDRRAVLHFIPAYCPHLNPIERLWGLMHRELTHNRCYRHYRDFANAILGFLRRTVPEKWRDLCDHVPDNFRVIDPRKVRILE